MKVYFIPGLGANSKCFQFIKLPEGFEKEYIEWYTPEKKGTLDGYVRKMAESIDISEPFILAGYSFGGIIAQEMNKFLQPQKTILIASMKEEEQKPLLFKIVHKIKLAKWFPMGFFSRKGVLSYAFARTVYFKSRKAKLKVTAKLDDYMSHINPLYMKWSIETITRWKSDYECKNIYQIHGTKDPIFPYNKIRKSYNQENYKYLKTIEGANHLLVLEAPKKVNEAIKSILLD